MISFDDEEETNNEEVSAEEYEAQIVEDYLEAEGYYDAMEEDYKTEED